MAMSRKYYKRRSISQTFFAHTKFHEKMHITMRTAERQTVVTFCQINLSRVSTPALSTPALSTLVISCRVVHSRVFSAPDQPCHPETRGSTAFHFEVYISRPNCLHWQVLLTMTRFIYLLLKSYTKCKRKIKIYKGNRTIHRSILINLQFSWPSSLILTWADLWSNVTVLGFCARFHCAMHVTYGGIATVKNGFHFPSNATYATHATQRTDVTQRTQLTERKQRLLLSSRFVRCRWIGQIVTLILLWLYIVWGIQVFATQSSVTSSM